MASHFFCNVYRELDRGSAYFRQQIHRKSAAGKLESVLWLSTVYRLMNKIETFEGKLAGGGQWERGIPSQSEFADFSLYLTQCMKKKVAVFTSAHQNSGLKRYIETLQGLSTDLDKYCARLRKSKNMESCFYEVKKLPNVGNFFAWQIMCDLIESRALPQAFGEHEWVALGPGARAGLERIFPCTRSSNHSLVEQVALAKLLASAQNPAFFELGVSFPYFAGRPLSLKNIEHSLCEFEKYCCGKKAVANPRR
jgi:hypothetical protein